jgi:DNA polymerase-3 subunit gamma/tau
MGYQVLARKWRPGRFSELVGQEHVVTAISNALDNNRLHHAYLFTGTRGVGKTTIARIFSKSLNCEQGQSANPCGKCPTCLEIEQGNFVDLLEIDAASRTKVEDTRELLDNVQYKPTRGKYKVYLIDEVHMLSKHSFNALLKTLEEPPPHVKFLLATTDPQKLPITILSRCLQFNLKALSRDQISTQLAHILTEESVPFEQTALVLLARAAQGSMRDALSLTDQAIAQGDNQVNAAIVTDMLGLMDGQQLLKLLHGVITKQADTVMQIVADMAEQAPDFSQILAELASLLHQIALTQLVPDACKLETTSPKALYTLAKKVSAEHVQLLYQIALQGRKELPFAADGRSGLEMTLLRMLTFMPVPPQDDNKKIISEQSVVPTGNPDTMAAVEGAIAHPSQPKATQNSPDLDAEFAPSSNGNSADDAVLDPEYQGPIDEGQWDNSSTEHMPQSAANREEYDATLHDELAHIEQQSDNYFSASNYAMQTDSSAMSSEPNANEVIGAEVNTGHDGDHSRDDDHQSQETEVDSLHTMQDMLALRQRLKRNQGEATSKEEKKSLAEQAKPETNPFAARLKQAALERQDNKDSQTHGASREPFAHSSEPSAHGSEPSAHGAEPSAHGSEPSAHGTEPSAHESAPLASEAEASPAFHSTHDSEPPPWVLENTQGDRVDQGPEFKKEDKHPLESHYLQQGESTPSQPPTSMQKADDIPQPQNHWLSDGELKPYLDNGEKLVHSSQLNDWSALIERMPIAGLLKQVALHSLFSRQNNIVTLELDASQQHLLNESAKSHLQQALGDALGESIELEIKLGDAQGTPFQLQENINRMRQQYAQHVVASDAVLQSIVTTFNAAVVEDTITPR